MVDSHEPDDPGQAKGPPCSLRRAQLFLEVRRDVLRRTIDVSVSEIKLVEAALRSFAPLMKFYDGRRTDDASPTAPKEIDVTVTEWPKFLTNAPPAPDRSKPPTGQTETTREEGDPRISPLLSNRYTPARVAIAERDYPTHRNIDDIHAEMAALPGDALTKKSVQSLCTSILKLHRPDDFVSGTRGIRAPKPVPVEQPRGRMDALMRVARSIQQTATPPARPAPPDPVLTSRDGYFSMAGAQMQNDDRANGDVARVKWEAVVEWADANRVKLNGTREDMLACVNARRSDEKLPLFEVLRWVLLS